MRARITTLAAIAAVAALLSAPSAGARNDTHKHLFGGSRGLKGSGDLVTKEIDVTGFDRISLDAGFDVTVTAGGSFEVQATVDDNLVDNLVIEVEGKTLHLDWDKDCRPNRGCRVEISLPMIRGLEINGAGDVTMTGIDSEELDIDISGAGDIDASGTAGTLELAISGAGDIDARDLKAQDVTVRVSGAGSANVYAEKSLDASVSGVGSINYYGDPRDRETHVSGVGSIHRR